MVVMEHTNAAPFPRHPSPKVLAQVQTAKNILHPEGRVHGDLRPPNVLLESRGKQRVMSIDFEWSGRDGKVRFPYTLNTRILWLRGVHGGGCITKFQDDATFEASSRNAN